MSLAAPVRVADQCRVATGAQGAVELVNGALCLRAPIRVAVPGYIASQLLEGEVAVRQPVGRFVGPCAPGRAPGRANTAAHQGPQPRDGVGTESASDVQDHDPLTTAESINDPRRSHIPTRPELRPTVSNGRQPAQKSGADSDNISSAPTPCSRFAPVSVHTGCANDHYKIDIDRTRWPVSCANMTDTARNARVELRGFEPLTP